MTATSTVSLVKELLKVVGSLEEQGVNGHLQPQQAYEATRRVEALTDEIKRAVLGPLEYTIQIAGSSLSHSNQLGVADVIGDDVKTLFALPLAFLTFWWYSPYAGTTISCLVAHGYFEVDGFGSRVYRNNDMFNILRSHDSNTLCDAIGFICDDEFKSAAHLVETARAAGNTGGKKTKAAFHVAFGFDRPVFEWYSDPAQVWRGQRMSRAMEQLHRMANGNVVTGTHQFLTLRRPRSFGERSIERRVNRLRLAWSTQPAVAQTRVSFAAGDFLAPTLDATGLPRGQPTYLIRHVLHDWTDDEAAGILGNVRAAMIASDAAGTRKAQGQAPKLLLCEMLLQERSGRFVYTTSMQALSLNNGRTRTEAEMCGLLKRAGFSEVVRLGAVPWSFMHIN
ncbi:uncharacterized protein PHACADRAFT_214909 [Phanerochaete carnosa HHB-10118-sp]|uniref:O-methyltransferase C-terminal domain-containing protein n=1 Tax=Phanerochaete carnosa (strain HHB-10118-sp) TaxID=650164 RepID=K5WDE8_PHACS|nr:uncharacterized protein PHACADRAFT_214909 [Phanerochaete carnosa HHB-10118-sp]EKM48202.1 hypothetical protein PHACADRAFT_214909 [Phanerochaete carnosa HHB-10118-sp]